VTWFWILAAVVILPIVFAIDRRRIARARREPLYAAKRADATYRWVRERQLLMAIALIVAGLSEIRDGWHLAAFAFLFTAVAFLIVLVLRRKAHEARDAAGVRSEADYRGLDFP
jgi:hypothetical protein